MYLAVWNIYPVCLQLVRPLKSGHLTNQDTSFCPRLKRFINSAQHGRYMINSTHITVSQWSSPLCVFYGLLCSKSCTMLSCSLIFNFLATYTYLIVPIWNKVVATSTVPWWLMPEESRGHTIPIGRPLAGSLPRHMIKLWKTLVQLSYSRHYLNDDIILTDLLYARV